RCQGGARRADQGATPMMILGFDPSKTAGWAYYDPDAKLSAIICGNLKADKEAVDLEHAAGSVGRAASKLIKDIGRPHFIAIETPPRIPFIGANKKRRPKFKTELDLVPVTGHEPDDIGGGGGIQGIGAFASTNQIAAALATVAECYGIPFEMLKTESWR